MKTAILTDSAALLPTRLSTATNLKILQIPFTLADQTYYPDQDASVAQLANLQEQAADSLTEAPISLPKITALLTDLQAEGYTDVICIHLAEALSGLGANLRQAVKKASVPLNLHLLDSYSLGAAEGNLVVAAAQLIDQGQEPADIVAHLKKLRHRQHTLLIMDDLKNLRKTGSIARTSRHLENTLLRRKSLLHFTKNGDLEVLLTSSRTKKILQNVQQRLSDLTAYARPQHLSLVTEDPEALADYTAELQAVLPSAQLNSQLSSPTIFAFMGPQTLLLSWSE
ncbi:MAG TPA: DegV family EDD domain-containing protein [Candidatus Ligilactobacillus excrementipullorum]|nr:DegV family EDD domain-containing protein [Candidatus Ligilactobacillus excrementipullorum]